MNGFKITQTKKLFFKFAAEKFGAYYAAYYICAIK
jgi:hypothetical protein